MSSLLDHKAIVQFDENVDKAFDSLRRTPSANRLFYGLSEAANHSMIWHVFAWLSQNNKWKSPLYGFAGLVAISRIHVKIHHASDVVAGAVIGTTFGTLAKKIVFKRP